MKRKRFILFVIAAATTTQAQASNLFDRINGVESRQNFGDYIVNIPSDLERPSMNCSSYGEMLGKLNFLFLCLFFFVITVRELIDAILKFIFKKDKFENLKKKVNDLEKKIETLEKYNQGLVHGRIIYQHQT